MRVNREIYNIEGPNKKIVLISDIHFYPKYNLKRFNLLYKNRSVRSRGISITRNKGPFQFIIMTTRQYTFS